MGTKVSIWIIGQKKRGEKWAFKKVYIELEEYPIEILEAILEILEEEED